MERNIIPFQDLVKGQYGRKTAYFNAQAITPQNVVKACAKAVTTLNTNRTAIRYLWNYYKGDQPILYRQKMVRDDICNKIVENHAYEVVQFKVGQTYGEPIQCVSRSDDDAINKAVDKLNDYLKDAGKQTKDITCGEWQSAVGFGYKGIYYKGKSDIPFGIVTPDPTNTVILYSSVTGEPLMAVQDLKDENDEQYYQIYTATHECMIKNSKIVPGSWKLHIFGEIPIVEYPNNSIRLSDIELIIDILDALNNMQSNRMDSIEQFVQFCMVFTNCEVDENSISQLSKTGAIALKTNNKDNKASFDIIDTQLNQTESQVAKQDLWDNALTISAIPNKQGGTGGDSQGAVELRNGWDFSKNRAKLKDPFVMEAEKKICRSALNAIRVAKGNTDCPITTSDFDIQINHSPTDNMIIKCQALQYLKDCGINPLVAIRTVGLWGDAEKVFMLSKEYIDTVWPSIENADEEMARAQKLLEDMPNANS